MKRTPHVSRCLFLVLLLSCASFAACDTVTDYYHSIAKSVGLETGKKKLDKKTKHVSDEKSGLLSDTPAEDDATPTEDDQDSQDKPTNGDIVITTSDDSKGVTAKDTNLKTAVAPEFKVEAPVHVKRRVGGVARFIHADEKFVYMDYPQHFALYNKDLNLLATIAVKSAVQNVKRFDAEGQTLFYLSEENNVLAILKLGQTVTGTETGYTLTELTSKEMKAPYFVLDPVTVLSFEKNKVSVMDFGNVSELRIINEYPQSNVNDAIKLGKFLYLARNDYLDVLDPENGTVLSSVRVGKKFSFAGVDTRDGQNNLVLTFPNHNGDLDGVQRLKLAADSSGVTDFAENIFLPVPLSHYSIDIASDLIVGREAGVKADNPVQIFSLKEKRFLRGSLSEQTKLRTWSFFNGELFLVNDLQITANQIDLDHNVIAQDKSLQKIIGNQNNVPLAQIGASKLVRDEYTVGETKRLEFMSDSRKVVLLDKDHFVMIENTRDGHTHRLFATKNFQANDFLLTEPLTTVSTRFDKILPTALGVFAYNNDADKFFLLDSSFEKLIPLPLASGELISWAHFSEGNADYLIVSQKQTSKGPKSSVEQSVITFYQIISEQNFKVVKSLTYNEPAFVFYVPDNQIIILTSSKLDLYDWMALSGQKTETVTSTDTGTVTATQKNAKATTPSTATEPQDSADLKTLAVNFLDVKMSPAFDTVYGLIKQNDIYKIIAVNMFNTADVAMIDDIEITPEHFQGSTFSKNGRLFILPSSVGTLFYDMTDLAQIKEVAHWPLPSYYVDVADQGQYVCVTLGYQGVYCGDLLF